jgi:predicted dehydrogenase/threonine dehydrogenase-like Zn-dependent dehydrogenase
MIFAASTRHGQLADLSRFRHLSFASHEECSYGNSADRLLWPPHRAKRFRSAEARTREHRDTRSVFVKQIVRRVIDRRGRIAVIELPAPHMGPNQVLIQNAYSLISSGTELSTLSKTPTELVRQTLSDPWMRQVVNHTIFSTGLAQTTRRVWAEMVMPREIGYSGAGKVVATGSAVEGLRVGDTVAYASRGHAEIVAPSINHTVGVPDDVDLRHAAFVTVGGIAMQSLRRADAQFGEVVAIYGLGLVGQLCAQIAKAAGLVVIGIDVNEARNRLALQGGVDFVVNATDEDVKRRVMDYTAKQGADATIICASSKSDDIVNTSMEITRKQGRVVIVGYVGLNVHPKNFLYREIDLRYSRAYGPGSYHTGYEKGRLDYPFGYVRWTERRNLQEFIRLIATRAISLEQLIGRTYPIADAQQAFDAIREGTLGGVAALIEYDITKAPALAKTIPVRPRQKAEGKVGISVVGIGNHVLGHHLPNLRSIRGLEVRGLVSATGRNATTIAERVNATIITTDIDEVLRDSDTDGVMICSTQPEHAGHLKKTIAAGKAVFVEKPMVMHLSEFSEISQLMRDKPVLFTLGLNRRYSPLVTKLRSVLHAPVVSVTYSIMQPFLPPDHWSLDETEGGGRLVAEGEHFIDLCNLLIGRPPLAVFARTLGKTPDDLRKLCNFAVTVHYDGAVANVIFNESGAPGYPRERVVVLAPGQVAELDDFASLTVHGRRKQKFGGMQKEMGHRQELVEFVAALRGEPNSMLTWQEASLATLCMFAAEESLRSGEPIYLTGFREQLDASHLEIQAIESARTDAEVRG